MRAFITLGLILAGTSYLSSQNNSWHNNKKKVTGNGNVIEKTQTIKDFHALQIGDTFKVHLIQDDEQKVVLITDENLHEHIAVTNKNGVLSIKTQADFRETKDLTVYVTFKDLDHMNFGGACIVNAENQLKFDDLDLSLAGAVNSELDISTNTLNVNVSGASSITLSGTTQKSEIVVNGAANFNAEKFSIDEANINVSGGGSADIMVNHTLEANVSGGGLLEYSGDPSNVQENISGGAHVLIKNKCDFIVFISSFLIRKSAFFILILRREQSAASSSRTVPLSVLMALSIIIQSPETTTKTT